LFYPKAGRGVSFKDRLKEGRGNEKRRERIKSKMHGSND